MKKILLAAVMTVSAMSMMADLNGDAYYRAQNAVTKRYAYLLDDKGSVDIATTSADVNALHLYSGFLKASSDPSTVFFFENRGGIEYNVTGQGASLYNLFGQYMKIMKTKQYDGKQGYLLYAQKNGMTKYLGDLRADNSNEKGSPSIQATGDRRIWYIDDVAPSGSNYFGVAPTLSVGGKYYQPFFAGFSFAPYSSGVKAYIVSRIEPSMGVVVISEVTGKVPVGTPVIMECANPLAADNRLTIGPSGSGADVSSNRLMGVYFDNDSQLHYNRTPYDKTSMRSLVVKDGKLKFVVGNYDFCPRNEAILKLPDAASQAIQEYDVMTEADYNAYIEALNNMVPDGYYRMQNASTKRYAYLLDKTGSASNVSSMMLYSDILKANSDPASVLSASHVEGAGVSVRNFSGQGTSTKTAFGDITLTPADVREGVQSYYVATSAGNIGDSSASGDKGVASVGVTGDAAKWWFNAIDIAGPNHFGVAPSLTAGGKYYQPFMADFPVAASSDGMKFYIVDRIDSDFGVMVLEPVDGVIPAGTPVIVECANPLAVDNKLTVGATGTQANVSGNLLKATYNEYSENGHNNFTYYRPADMRSLAVEDGRLKFIAGTQSILPRNEAYIELQNDLQKGVDSYTLVSREEYDQIVAKATTALSGIADGGYYRVQNVATKRNLHLVDNKGSVNANGTSDLGALNLYCDMLKAASDPASIFSVSKKSDDVIPEWELASQGVNLSGFANAGIRFMPGEENEGGQSFDAYVQKSNKKIYLNDENGDEDGAVTASATPANSSWQLNAVDETDAANYFGIAPSVTASGRYYHPFVASFPFIPYSEGVKVYVITRIDPEHKEMVRTEVEGEVKAGLPVIIECENPLAADNRLTLLRTANANTYTNYLKGVYFDNASEGHVNQTPYDRNSMRSLAEVDGKLMFVKGDYDVVPRNQAYVLLTGDDQKAVDEYEVLTPEEYEERNGVALIGEDSIVDVYQLDGVLVRSGIRRADVHELPHGIYLIRMGSSTEKLKI